MSFDEEGGIAKMVANKLGVDSSGQWLLPFWREMGGHNCTNAPGMHGVPGILLSSDQASPPSPRPVTNFGQLSSWINLQGFDCDLQARTLQKAVLDFSSKHVVPYFAVFAAAHLISSALDLSFSLTSCLHLHAGGQLAGRQHIS